MGDKEVINKYETGFLISGGNTANPGKTCREKISVMLLKDYFFWNGNRCRPSPSARNAGPRAPYSFHPTWNFPLRHMIYGIWRCRSNVLIKSVYCRFETILHVRLFAWNPIIWAFEVRTPENLTESSCAISLTHVGCVLFFCLVLPVTTFRFLCFTRRCKKSRAFSFKGPVIIKYYCTPVLRLPPSTTSFSCSLLSHRQSPSSQWLSLSFPHYQSPSETAYSAISTLQTQMFRLLIVSFSSARARSNSELCNGYCKAVIQPFQPMVWRRVTSIIWFLIPTISATKIPHL